MDPLDAIKATFFEECSELMESLEAGLLALQAGRQDPDTVDSVFRAVHSIKGGAGAFDLGVLVAFAHDFETTLDALRSGRLAPTADVIAVFLRSSDQLGDLIAASKAGEEVASPPTDDLKALLGDMADAGADGADEFAPVMLDFGLDPMPEDQLPPAEEAQPSEKEAAEPSASETAGQPRLWSIQFEPLPDLLVSGNEPLYLFRALEVMGRLTVEAADSDLPDLADMDPAIPRLRWRILLEPSAPDLTETEIESVFEFAVDLCVLKIEPSAHRQSDPVLAESALAEKAKETDSDAPTPPASDPPPASSAAEVPVAPAPPRPEAASPASTTIRVDLARVDRLVNLVGELVISQSMLAQDMTRAGLDQHSEAISTLDELQHLTRSMQDSVMSIRAQPVKSLFQRMTRIVREAAQATGKDVRLVTEGEGTEIDKTVVERLADPLTHMIRNAIDHGLEPADARRATDKEPTGTVRLTARQQSDRVVIEVSDDGRGINRTRVLQRAIERGLLPEGATPEPGEIDRLLFMPGFSTNTEVSPLSGRGVGMDVVQRAIRDLNGAISISSTEGEGCTISISLPLTLAILDGMIVRSNNQRMVIPLSAIVETQTMSAARIENIGTDNRVVQLHDRFVPMVDLARGMGFASTRDAEGIDPEDAALLFVEPDDSGLFALCVDAIEAQRQVVIKGLSENFGNIPCVSAATILGDGQVALIVDPVGIASHARLQHRHPTPQPKAHAS